MTESGRDRGGGREQQFSCMYNTCICLYVCMYVCTCSQSIERAGEGEGKREGDRTAVGAHDDMTKHLDWVEAWVAILQRNLQSVDNTHSRTHTQEYITRIHGT